MKPSGADFENPRPVDKVFRQDKCISVDSVNNSSGDLYSIPEHGGKISCLEACQMQSQNFKFAFIYENSCMCGYYKNMENRVIAYDPSLHCSPCQDNESFTCGSNSDYYSVYHLEDDFSVNQVGLDRSFQCALRISWIFCNSFLSLIGL